MSDDKDIYADADAIEQQAVRRAEAETTLAERLADITARLEALEAHFTTHGLTELARIMEQRIKARIQQSKAESEAKG